MGHFEIPTQRQVPSNISASHGRSLEDQTDTPVLSPPHQGTPTAGQFSSLSPHPQVTSDQNPNKPNINIEPRAPLPSSRGTATLRPPNPTPSDPLSTTQGARGADSNHPRSAPLSPRTTPILTQPNRPLPFHPPGGGQGIPTQGRSQRASQSQLHASSNVILNQANPTLRPNLPSSGQEFDPYQTVALDAQTFDTPVA